MPARLLVTALLALLLSASCAVGLSHAAPPQPLKGNPADRLADKPIDDPRYDHARHCRRDPAPGTLALHRDHVHFGLSRAGAAKRTSFWR